MIYRNLFAATASALTLTVASAVMAQDTVTYMGWSQTEVGKEETFGKVMSAFESAHPDVDVETIGFPFASMVKNYILRIRTGQPVDVAQLQDRWLSTFVATGNLADLSEVFGQDYLDETIVPSLLSYGQLGDAQYGVPLTAASVAVVANKKLLNAAGVEELPETWEEWIAAMEAIKEHDPEAIPFGFSTKNPKLIQFESQIVFWQHGARYLDRDCNVLVDSPEARKALQFLKDMVDRGFVARGNDRFDTRALFAQELVGFYFDPPVARQFATAHREDESYAKNVVVMPTPVMDNGEPPRSIQWSHLLSMFNHMGEPEADSPAGKLLKHLVGTEAQMTFWEELGAFPVNQDALAKLSDNEYVTDWIELTETALPNEPSFYPNASKLTDIIGEEIQAAMITDKSADEAITDMASRLEKALGSLDQCES